jgi:hypothetical protein
MFKHFPVAAFCMLLTSAAVLAEEKVPKGAERISPDVHRYVDKDGKAWLYRQTPFGITKTAEEQASTKAQAPEASSSGTRMTPFGETKAGGAIEETARGRQSSGGSAVKTNVIEDADSLRFERPSPFGVYKWSRKKTELTADEQRLWDEHKASASVTQKAK